MRKDEGGMFWDTVFDAVSLCFSVADVINNPDDPWVWVGLAADVASLVIPFATGGGLAVKTAAKVDDAVDMVKAVDNTIDTFKVADNAIDAIDTGSDIYRSFENGTDTLKGIDNTIGSMKQKKAISDCVTSRKSGWTLGEPVDNLTRAGNEPSWSTVRQRFWKNEAFYNSGDYSASNLQRMKKGLAPLDAKGISYELHHPNGRVGKHFYDFYPVTRDHHKIIHGKR